VRTFCTTSAATRSGPSRCGIVASTTVRAASALRSHEATVGIFCSTGSFGLRSAFMAPQSEWPQTTTSVTSSAVQAYSTTADTPPIISP